MTEHTYHHECVNDGGHKHSVNYKGVRSGNDYKMYTIGGATNWVTKSGFLDGGAHDQTIFNTYTIHNQSHNHHFLPKHIFINILKRTK